MCRRPWHAWPAAVEWRVDPESCKSWHQRHLRDCPCTCAGRLRTEDASSQPAPWGQLPGRPSPNVRARLPWPSEGALSFRSLPPSGRVLSVAPEAVRCGVAVWIAWRHAVATACAWPRRTCCSCLIAWCQWSRPPLWRAPTPSWLPTAAGVSLAVELAAVRQCWHQRHSQPALAPPRAVSVPGGGHRATRRRGGSARRRQAADARCAHCQRANASSSACQPSRSGLCTLSVPGGAAARVRAPERSLRELSLAERLRESPRVSATRGATCSRMAGAPKLLIVLCARPPTPGGDAT